MGRVESLLFVSHLATVKPRRRLEPWEMNDGWLDWRAVPHCGVGNGGFRRVRVVTNAVTWMKRRCPYRPTSSIDSCLFSLLPFHLHLFNTRNCEQLQVNQGFENDSSYMAKSVSACQLRFELHISAPDSNGGHFNCVGTAHGCNNRAGRETKAKGNRPY